MSSLSSEPPDPDVIEVSIFGPGKGESILVHIGDGEWIVVDSCISGTDRSVPALAYLRQIGVAASSQVRLVVGTHAHDDHIAGLSQVFEACESAYFVCSAAASDVEMQALVELDGMIPEKGARVRKEYSRIYDLIHQRGTIQHGVAQLKIASEQAPLWIRNHQSLNVKITALSPSALSVQRSRTAIQNKLLSLTNSDIRAQPADPNELAVALWIEVGDKAILLGGDLLIGPQGCGWKAVVSTHRASMRASIHKVPHHGSDNAHFPEVWSDLLDPQVIALLAPFRGGRKPLPSSEDMARISGLTPNGFVTASVQDKGASRDIRKAKAALGTLAMNVRDPMGKVGHVRARSRIGESNWIVNGSIQAGEIVAGRTRSFATRHVQTR